MEKLNILLIEDDADDIELLRDALQSNNINCHMDVLMEGDRVLSHLDRMSTLPDVIVMDLNLPKVHGREILSTIRSVPAYAGIPIVVLTTSAALEDIKFAYSMGAEKFITKPNTIQGFNATVEAIVSLAETQ